MLDPSLRIAILAVALACSACQPSSERQAAAAKDTIERFCTDCHNDAERAGNLTLASTRPEDVAAHPEIYENVVRKLRSNLMPPPSEPRPEQVEEQAFVTALERYLKAGRRVLVLRTFSKAYSLCFQRVGYFVGHPELIAALDKMRDSYNVNRLSQVGAEAALDDWAYYEANVQRICATRQRVVGVLESWSCGVLPSQTNCSPSSKSHRKRPGGSTQSRALRRATVPPCSATH